MMQFLFLFLSLFLFLFLFLLLFLLLFLFIFRFLFPFLFPGILLPQNEGMGIRMPGHGQGVLHLGSFDYGPQLRSNEKERNQSVQQSLSSPLRDAVVSLDGLGHLRRRCRLRYLDKSIDFESNGNDSRLMT